MMTLKMFLSVAAAGLAVAAEAAIPLPEHPRPDWQREDWINLNGEWDFSFDVSGTNFDQKILVPFGWGSPLSGVKVPMHLARQPNTTHLSTGKEPKNEAWYRRGITVPKEWAGRRVFVVVGAADHTSVVYLDGHRLGTHEGGYTPFEFELTPFVKFGESQVLKIYTEDQQKSSRLFGKQGYGNVHGIWQTVYLEARGDRDGVYLRHVLFRPDIDANRVFADIELGSPAKRKVGGFIKFKPEDRKDYVRFEFEPGEISKTVEIPFEKARLWELDDPYLYEVDVNAGLDSVCTYFGMRKVSVGNLPGTDYPYVFLNNRPLYLRLTLDQSYTYEGFYTFPSDEYMKREIEISKKLALNGNRIHIKVEVPRKLYWADKLGLLIMADVPNWWGAPDDDAFNEHAATFAKMVERDFNHPSIFSWVLFNETWGLLTRTSKDGEPWRTKYLPQTQARVAREWAWAKAIDPTRLVEDMSPCSRDHVVSDIDTWHNYAPGWMWEGILDDVCGSSADRQYIDGHVSTGGPMFNSECGNVWGYFGSTGDCDWSWDYHMMMDAFRRHPRCAGWLYTEHHDVTNEWNGYVKADRTWKETGIEELFPGMTLADLHGDVYLALGEELFREADAGATVKVPIYVSAMTDSIILIADEVRVTAKIRAWDADGNLVEKDCGMVYEHPRDKFLKPYHFEKLGEASITLPDTACVGTVNFELEVERTWCEETEEGSDMMFESGALARNFTTFATRARPDADRIAGKLVGGEWSLGETNVLGGLKVSGLGKGHFDYEFVLPKDGTFSGDAEFVAEVSTRPQYGKDLGSTEEADMAAMLGLASCDPTMKENSYQMTDAYKHPGKVLVKLGEKVVGEAELPDDPADHRGILSWGHQTKGTAGDFKSRRLHDAGTYGFIVKATIPAADLKAANGRLVIRLEAPEKTGLAVYGEKFGRYPTGPALKLAK